MFSPNVSSHHCPHGKGDGQRTAALLGALHGFVGQPRGLDEVASPDLDQRVAACDGREIVLGAALGASAVQRLHSGVGRVQLPCPSQHQTLDHAGAERGEHVDVGIFQLHRPSQTDLVDPVSVHEVQLDRHCERSADEGRIAELLGVCHRHARTDQRLIELRDHSLAECQHDQGLHKQGRAVLGVVERAFENSDGFGPVVVVEVYSGHQVERGSSQRPRRQLVQGLVRATRGLVRGRRR